MYAAPLIDAFKVLTEAARASVCDPSPVLKNRFACLLAFSRHADIHRFMDIQWKRAVRSQPQQDPYNRIMTPDRTAVAGAARGPPAAVLGITPAVTGG